MTEKTPAEQLQAALAVLAAVCDNADLHALNCPTCTGNFKCQGAEFWHREAADAAEVVKRLQQRARRAALAAR